MWLLLHVVLWVKLGFWGEFLGGKVWLYDFDNYFRMASDVLRGVNPYTVSYMGTPGPMLMIFPYLPFTLLNLEVARSLFTLVSITSGYLACVMLAKRFWVGNWVKAFWILATILFSAFTTRFNFITGQSGLVIMLMLTVLMTTRKEWAGGLALAWVITFKTYLILGVLGLVRKNFRMVLVSGLFLVGIVVVSLGIFKIDWWLGYTGGRLGEIVGSTGGSADLDYYSQTMRASFHRLRWDGAYIPAYAVSFVALAILVVWSGCWEAGVTAGLILSPVVWQHYFVILFPIGVKLWVKWASNPKKRIALAAVSWLWWAELKSVHGKPVGFPWNIIASQYFLVAWGLLVIIIMAREKLGIDRGVGKIYKK